MDGTLRNGLFGAAAIALVAGVGLQATGSTAAIVGFLCSALLLSAASIVMDPRRGSLITAIVCAGANAYLLYQKVDAAGPSICNVNDVLNCDIVNSSAASELFGIPVTLFGVAFYAGLALAAMLPASSSPRFHQVNGLFALISLTFSAYLAYEAAKLSAVCVMCITIYVGNGLLLWSAMRGLRADGGTGLMAGWPSALNSNSALAITATFVLTMLVGLPQVESKADGTRITRPDPAPEGGAPAPQPNELARLYWKARGEVRVTGEEPVLGKPDAPYVLLEIADFGCPHCAIAAKDVKQLVTEYPEVQVRFRVFPLTASCNPGIQQDPYPERCDAALAAECAERQGRFWEMNALLFANQRRFDRADLKFMADQVGLDVPRWEECLDAPAARDAVKADATLGAQTGLLGTPAMFLRGTHGAQFVEVRDAAAAARLIDAHRTGVTLPPPGPPPSY